MRGTRLEDTGFLELVGWFGVEVLYGGMGDLLLGVERCCID